VVTPDVGGGFGTKCSIYPEDMLIPVAAMRLGRPVKWVETRREHLQSATHSREQLHDVRLAATRDGTMAEFGTGCGVGTAWLRSGVRGEKARIVTADGVEHQIDTIVLGTGFHVTDMPVMHHIRGRDGRTLAQAWDPTMRAYLGTDPTWAEQFSKVWLWADWPGAAANKQDTGIDLVAQDRETGGFCAIQCKFYEPDHTVQKADIDSFFTASGKGGFTRRMIISTTLEDAALNLGASHAAVLWNVTLPYLMPALIGAAAIAFLMSFENFNTTLMLVGSDPPLTIMMYGRMREGASPVLNAVSLLLMVASAAIALSLMRRPSR
jgi:hypothetical protein